MHNEDPHVVKLTQLALAAVEDMKAKDVVVLNVEKTASFTTVMVIASGTSTRHVKSIAGNVVYEAKHADLPPMGVEGERSGEWVLVDMGDVVVHVMLADVREFYQLEKLWTPEAEESAEQG